jgi:hypothetical protein
MGARVGRQENPFQIGTLAEGAAFADRAAEVAQLRRVWETPGAKLVLYGDRRMGKTAAMHAAAALSRRARRRVVIVNLATAVDGPDAVRRLLTAVRGAVGRTWKTIVQDLAAKLRLTLTLTPSADGTGWPGIQLGIDPSAPVPRPGLFTDALDAIEFELAKRRLTLGLGLDEFQRLLAWGGEDIEWALKASLERHRHLSYVLAGSSRSLIEEMVTGRHRALWKAVDTLPLGPIPEAEFAAWIVARSRASGVPLGRTTAEAVVAMVGPRTRDIVQLAGAVWEDARVTGGPGDPARACDALVATADALYLRLWEGGTDRERRILRALAGEPGIEPTSTAARERYGLGAPSTVAKALSALVARELLAREGPRYVFDDPFFRRWVQVSGAAA